MIYRATTEAIPIVPTLYPTPRPPGNVPYLVDNLWEWLRPDSYPSRRFSAFAAPTPEGALASVGGGAQYNVGRVRFMDGQTACQIVAGDQPNDARYHADVKALQRLVVGRLLGKPWLGAPEAETTPEAALFLPCANRHRVGAALDASTVLGSDIADAIRQTSTFWNDAVLFDPSSEPPHRSGEIFFTGAYALESA